MATQTLPDVAPSLRDMLTSEQARTLAAALFGHEATLRRRLNREQHPDIKRLLQDELNVVLNLNTEVRK